MKKWFGGAFICLCGAVVGFINGFMGAGGGIIVVFILSTICKIETKKAHATAVLIILPVCLVSAVTYMINQFVNFEIVFSVGIGSILGGILGTFALKKMKANIIDCIFYVIMIVAGIRMLI